MGKGEFMDGSVPLKGGSNVTQTKEPSDEAKETLDKLVANEQKEEKLQGEEETQPVTAEKSSTENKETEQTDDGNENEPQSETEEDDLPEITLETEPVVEEPKEKGSVYKSEWAKKYDEFYEKYGGTPEDFIQATQNFEDLSEEDLIKRAIKIENPDFDDDEVEFEFEDKFKYDEDFDEEREIKRKKIEYKKALRKANKTVEKFKEQFFVEKTKKNELQTEQLEEQQRAIEEQHRIWSESVNKANDKLNGLKIKVSDDFSYVQKINPEAKKHVAEIASDTTMNKWVQKYVSEDNSVDVEKLQVDLYIRDNFAEIIKTAIDQGRQYERSIIKKQEKNIDFSNSSAKPKVDALPKEKRAAFDLLAKKYNIK